MSCVVATSIPSTTNIGPMIRGRHLVRARLSACSPLALRPVARAGFATSGIVKMKIHPVPVRDDNYAYIIQSSVDGKAVFVDPFDIPTVHKAAEKLGIADKDVVGLLTTHHHADHSGGNETFAATFPHRPVYGGSNKIPALTNQVQDAENINDLLKGVQIKCLATPCHTQDHICYYLSDNKSNAVFTGDTLFISGAGRFFEGEPVEMLAAMDKLSALPDDTVVYCGHEYTKSNVIFSAAVLNKQSLQKLIDQLKADPKAITTGVYTIADERIHNPFMRTRDANLKSSLASHAGPTNLDDPAAVMGLLRKLKNEGTLKANI